MSLSRQFIHNFKVEASRIGYGRALERSLYYTANKLVSLRRIEIIHLTRDRLAPIDPAKYANVTSQLATEQELLAMRADGRWNIDDESMDRFRTGDSCLLSFIDGKRAGYTWVHTSGRPRLFPNLRITIPEDYVYNFHGFTLPEFRGHGLQAYRHHAILGRPEWRDRKGLIGYVHCVNWSSRRGQSKSGYQPLGSISLVGTHDRFAVLVSRELKQLGIGRIDA